VELPAWGVGEQRKIVYTDEKCKLTILRLVNDIFLCQLKHFQVDHYFMMHQTFKLNRKNIFKKIFYAPFNLSTATD